ncbi:MAG: flavin monoamine oxidase family protein [Hyphomonadaceae bacterium]
MPRAFDIAIVGGGVAGCYCAYRLSAARPRARIGLFEATGRLGGRLETTFLPDVAIPAELGGAFVSSLHTRVLALAHDLDLGLTPVAWSRRFSFVRGKRLTDQTYRDEPDTVPYQLAPHQRGESPAEILRGAIGAIAPRLRALWPERAASTADPDAIDQYLRRLRVKQRLLDDWSFRTLLREVIGDEALECLATAFGSSSNFGEASAYNAIRTLLDEMTPQRPFVFAAGNQQFPTELARRSGAEIHLDNALACVRNVDGALHLSFDSRAGEESFTAKDLILALPPEAVACIDFGPQHAAAQQALVAKVAPASACKLFLSFESAWWPAAPHSPSALGMAAWHTDQPIQQCYSHDGDNAAPALLLALFADGENAAFWAPHFGKGGAASAATIETALTQLHAMHGDIPEPSGAVARMWPAAWHVWRPGARSWRSAPAIRGPHFGLPIYICGEAFSEQQGWIEGALASAEALLREKFLT